MKTKLKTAMLLFAVLAIAACKKNEEATPEEETKTEVTTSIATEGNIKITGATNDQVKYDDKIVTVKSFTVDKVSSYVTTGYAQFNVQSTEKDGIFTKYSIGINLLTGLPATGVKTNILSGTTPLIGLNLYENSALYPFTAMNGTFTVDANDGHNATITVSDMDMKQSYMQGFDPSLKRFTVKSFKFKVSY